VLQGQGLTVAKVKSKHARNPVSDSADRLEELIRGIKAIKGKPTTETLSWISEKLTSIRDVLLEPDPVLQRAYLIAIALRQSTRPVEKMVAGQMKQFVYIEDRSLYTWAVLESHKLPEHFAHARG
jgi:hypothetical protein